MTGDPNHTSCASACAGECCVGNYACDGFTGILCKDLASPSCSGSFACFAADIPFVKKSCIGDKSCQRAGLAGNITGVLTESCRGTQSCYGLGYLGNIGNVTSSCDGVSACENAGSGTGGIGGLIGSCNANKACYQAGKDGSNAIGTTLQDCCNTEEECDNANQTTIPGSCQVSEGVT